jgi:hypothetical protein
MVLGSKVTYLYITKNLLHFIGARISENYGVTYGIQAVATKVRLVTSENYNLPLLIERFSDFTSVDKVVSH